MQLKTLGFLLPLAFALSAQARPLEINCNEVGKVLGLVRQALAPEVLSNQSWIQLRPQKLNNGKCTVSLTSTIKSEIRHLIDREQPLNGLNCWATSLYLKGLRPVAIYAHEPEFRWFMNESQACRKLEAGESPQTGDIGAIRKQTNSGITEELHSFIYLHKNLAISKQNYSYDAEIELTHPDYFNQAFATEGTWTDYFRCGKPANPRTLDADTALFDKIQALALKAEIDLNAGVVIGENDQLQSEYLDKISEINHALFNAKPAPAMTYGRLLFESTIWQFSSLQSGARTPSKGNE